MRRNEILAVIGTCHRRREPGKQSPDGRLKECAYGRDIAKRVAAGLQALGYKSIIDYLPLDLPRTMQAPNAGLERQRELAMRVNFVNEVCRQEGSQNVIYVSIHVNAAGSDGQWRNARGWSAFVSDKASARSKLLASCLFDAAEDQGLKMRRPLPTQKFWEQSLYVLDHTLCPAVLTENLFQDNLDDVNFLLSSEGRKAIERLHVEGIIKYIESL